MKSGVYVSMSDMEKPVKKQDQIRELRYVNGS